MSFPAWRLAGAAALPLVALAVPPAFAQGSPPCNSGVCKLDVTVASCDDGQLAASRDPLVVPSPNNLEWTLATAGYRFAGNGIVVDGRGFSNNPGVTGNGRKFIVRNDWTDKNRDIKYAVRVVRVSDGKACAVWDPIIRNE